MTEIEKLLGEIKTQLKASMTPDLSKEQVDKFLEVDKKLDKVQEEYTSLNSKYDELKDAYINQAKNLGFRPNGSKGEDDESGETKSLDEILEEELNKTLEKEKK